jgi:acyl-CoA oxidase
MTCSFGQHSCVRRQFSDGPTSEKQIIDHKMQQYRVLPLIANAYALHFVQLAIGSMFKQMNKCASLFLIWFLHHHAHELTCREFADGQFGLLAPAHASSSGLKGYTTTIAAEGLEEARRACGGHGYSQVQLST